jgi:hypothetical protein
MSVTDSQKRLRRIAIILEQGGYIRVEDRKFLSKALNEIADGSDANKAFDVLARRGERKSEDARLRRKRQTFAMAWIAAARLPEEEGGLGLTLESACQNLGWYGPRGFGLSEETLRTYWNKKPLSRRVIFRPED